jgi:hypothetical protein
MFEGQSNSLFPTKVKVKVVTRTKCALLIIFAHIWASRTNSEGSMWIMDCVGYVHEGKVNSPRESFAQGVHLLTVMTCYLIFGAKILVRNFER